MPSNDEIKETFCDVCFTLITAGTSLPPLLSAKRCSSLYFLMSIVVAFTHPFILNLLSIVFRKVLGKRRRRPAAGESFIPIHFMA
jgi:hypothetical protein